MTLARISILLFGLSALNFASSLFAAPIRAGAAKVDISPHDFPVIRNGGFLEGQSTSISDPIHARALVLDDGNTEIAILVVDSCMLPREVCDQAKTLCSTSTGIPVERILISATHTHSAPGVMDYCLGSRADVDYTRFLIPLLAKAIESAHENLRPARLGWTTADASEFTKCRRWITRPDKMGQDPFGETTVRAMMHPGHLNPDYVGPSGPADPWLSILSVQTTEGQPLALLGNFSMHYFGGHPGVSADYCGRFAQMIAEQIAPADPDFVAIMSQGTSGDLWWGDYTLPKRQSWSIDEYTGELVELALTAWRGIEHRDDHSLAMAESKMTLDRRTPDERRLQWAREKIAAMNGQRPKNRPEVYAEQAVYLHENPSEEIVLQAIRIGGLGITAMPNEVYGLTGLKLKTQSPLQTTFNISLANGASGYIPPPEQHALGGYNTWPARTAGLEVQAEPKIVNGVLGLLEKASGDRRRDYVEYQGSYAKAIQVDRPTIRWSMAEQQRGIAGPSTTAGGTYIGNVAFHLPGVGTDAFGGIHRSRSVHFVGGKLVAPDVERTESYSLELWFWSGMPNNVRATTGTLFDFGGDVLAISGTDSDQPGRLTIGSLIGATELEPRKWYHVVLVRKQANVSVYLNGIQQSDLTGGVEQNLVTRGLSIAGDRDDKANFEGRIDEVAFYNHTLSPVQIAAHFQAAETTDSPPLSPNESAARTHVRDGYVLELVAAEPLVMDPVAIDWDSDGKLWVVEMADYPYGMDGKDKPGGRIRYLVDTDHDGRYDHSQLFMDGVNFPTSVMPWRKGVLITAAPEILYAEDRNGDGRADFVEPLFRGFMEGNQQLRVNSLRWGLDNWVYGASGGHHAGFGSKNQVTALKTGQVISLGSRDFRFRPDKNTLDPQSGPSQFGRVRDDWGNWFGVQNSFPIWHYVLPDHYMRRNPLVASPDPRKQLRLPPNPKVYMNKPAQKRFHSYEQSGRYTSACGPSIYRDSLLFPIQSGITHAFTCEPFHNVVQHHVLTDDGISFKGRRADEDGGKDFFASADRWSRPVMTRTGPDGALYVVDMYRYMIEHPDWLPQNGRSELKPFYRSGDDLGRIYRIYPKGRLPRDVPQLADSSNNVLTEALGSSNGRMRDMAHQLIVERKDLSLIEPLKTLARNHPSPRVRLQALGALDGLGGANESVLIAALTDKNPAVRTHAVRLSEASFKESELVRSAVLQLADDPNPRVRFQTAFSLGFIEGNAAGRELVRIAKSFESEPFAASAVLSSGGPHYSILAAHLLEAPHYTRALLKMGSLRPQGMEVLLTSLLDTSGNQVGLFTQWLDALEENGGSWDQFQSESDASMVKNLARANVLIKKARAQVSDFDTSQIEGESAFGLLGRQSALVTEDIEILQAHLSPRHTQVLQNAALKNLKRINHSHVGTSLLTTWKRYSPKIRSMVLDVLVSRSSWTRMLLDAVAADAVASTDIEPARRQRLIVHPNKEISSRSKKVLRYQADSDRQGALTHFQSATELKGNPDNGKTIFSARCAACHRLGEEGNQIGPDLRAVTDRSKSGFLDSIIDPNQSAAPKYLGYTAVLKNEESLYGMIETETGNSIVLRQLDGSERTVARTALRSLESSRLSFMPAGLEDGLSSQEMADLLEFLIGPQS